MATSGNITSNASSNRSISFNWSIASQSIANNQTTIVWNLVGTGSNTGWVESGNFQVKIDGNVVYSSSTRIRLYNGTVVAEGSYTFTHDNNGNKSFSAYIQAGIYAVAVNVSASGSWSLPQIARLASIDSFDKGTDIAQQMTIKYTPKATGFYYKLRLSIPNVIAVTTINLGTKATSQQTYNYTFTTAQLNTIYARWSGSSETIQIGAVIETYQDSNYSTKLGESNEYIRNMVLPASIKPTISAVTLSDATNAYSTIGAFVQSISKLNYSITASGIYNSTITNYTITASGTTYASSSSSSGTTNVIGQSGNLTITITAKDSRNRTASTTRTISVLAYTKPQITTFICSRNTSNLAQVIAQMKGSITSLNNNNTHTFKLEYATHGSSSFTTIQTYNQLSLDTSKTTTLTENGEYDFRLTATDRFNTVTKIYQVTQAFRLINFGADKKSICLGGFAERAGFESKTKAYFKEDVLLWNGSSYVSALPKTLYNNTSGTTGNVTLSETSANFSYLEIYYGLVNEDGSGTAYTTVKSTKIYAPNGKQVNLEGITYHANVTIAQLGIVTITISGTSLTRGTERYINVPNNSNPTIGTQSKIKIYRVVGYR